MTSHKPRKSHELRQLFLEFFESPPRSHERVPSDSLIPSGDPTVLFTSAGMNQFKDYFLGKRTDLRRATSCQKCLRTGDLEWVGKTPSHHSFFEMLGNFSFGDYFKAQAIAWAWEFLTGTLDFAGTKRSTTPELCLDLPAAKLWVSIYEEDEEAFKLWRALGVPEERIRRFGQADNFWPANAPKDGPNGPCGPCSEIYYDPEGKVRKESVEIWNLVFTQYDRQPDGTLKPLPKPNIDTGMGLERLARVIQGRETDYETDLFAPIVNKIATQLPNGTLPKDTVWTIADHLRAIVFLLSENPIPINELSGSSAPSSSGQGYVILPSNEGRGYVLRMLIRRAHWHGRKVLPLRGRKPYPLLASLADSVIDTYKNAYLELNQKRQFIVRLLDLEEKQFIKTLDAGKEYITAELDRLKQQNLRQISGDFAFRMKDTYGYPFELLVDIAHQSGVTVEQEIFHQRLEEQRERSRAASQFGQGIFLPTTLSLEGVAKSEFVGYQDLQADAVIKGIWKAGQWVSKAQQGDEVGVVLDRSPFYGESGGQIGDQGTIEAPQGVLDVVDTKWADELLVHYARVRQGTASVEEPVRALVDETHRLKVARSHTATHLLHWALRKVLGPETVQAGSLVEVERVRFDFSALGGLREEQWFQVERLVNQRICLADEVQTNLMGLEEARQSGALALFGEKYARQVRVVSISDYSRELCGGTHLRHTGFIGTFRLVTESSIAAGTRRVEAVVGEAALARQQEESQVLREIARQVSRPPHEALQGLEELLQQVKHSEKRLKTMQGELAQVRAQQLVAQAKRVDGVTLVSAQIDGAGREFLSTLADAIKRSLAEGVTLLVSQEQPTSVAWVMSLTGNVVKRGLHAGELLKAIAAVTGGGGGGRPDFAQAGGKDPSRIPDALKRAEELIHEALEDAKNSP